MYQDLCSLLSSNKKRTRKGQNSVSFKKYRNDLKFDIHRMTIEDYRDLCSKSKFFCLTEEEKKKFSSYTSRKSG